jgi:hypothetical protein
MDEVCISVRNLWPRNILNNLNSNKNSEKDKNNIYNICKISNNKINKIDDEGVRNVNEYRYEIYTYLCTCMYIYTCTHKYIYRYVHFFLCIYIYVYIHVFIYVYTYIHIYMYIYIYTNTYIFINIYKYRSLTIELKSEEFEYILLSTLMNIYKGALRYCIYVFI